MSSNVRWYDPYLNRWIQPDSIVPDPYDPGSWDRYNYVRSNPIRYNDPTGHDAGAQNSNCRVSGYCGNRAIKIFLGGSSGGNPRLIGPLPNKQAPEWARYADYSVQYKGNKNDQAAEAINRLNSANLDENSQIILVGYSAGGDSALIVAGTYTGKGQIDSVVVLGGTFTNPLYYNDGSEEALLSLSQVSNTIINERLIKGTNVLIVDDNAAYGDEPSNYSIGTNKPGDYLFLSIEQEHYSEGWPGVATNNSRSFFDWIWGWVYGH